MGNAQAVGAIAAIIVNNLPTDRALVSGSDPSITIPSVGISHSDGEALKAALARGDDDDSNNAKVKKVKVAFAFSATESAGTSQGLVRLYAPNPVQPGSSKSHWDRSATPNLLMDPSINSDLESATNLDLTPFLFVDIGWGLVP